MIAGSLLSSSGAGLLVSSDSGPFAFGVTFCLALSLIALALSIAVAVFFNLPAFSSKFLPLAPALLNPALALSFAFSSLASSGDLFFSSFFNSASAAFLSFRLPASVTAALALLIA